MKIKIHHILLTVVVLFFSGMLLSTLLKSVIKESHRLKSEVSNEDLLKRVEAPAKEYVKKISPEIDLDQILKAQFYFFKNKREIAVILSDAKKDHLLKLDFKNLSPGYGLRQKNNELTPPEGIYEVDYPGFISKTGLFVRILYPPESYKNYQRIEFENLKEDPFVISEKSFTQSFIQTDSEFINLFIYMILKLQKENMKILIYPDRPPLLMELGGTEFEGEIYRDLEKEYERLKALIESLKPFAELKK